MRIQMRITFPSIQTIERVEKIVDADDTNTGDKYWKYKPTVNKRNGIISAFYEHFIRNNNILAELQKNI